MARRATSLRQAAGVLLCGSLALSAGSVVVATVALAQGTPRAAGGDSLAANLLFLLAVLAFSTVGFLVVRQQPDNPIGWLLGAIGHLLGWLDLTNAYAALAVGEDLADGQGLVVLMALTNWMWVPAVGLLAIFLVLLFPDGRLPSDRWRWLPWTAVATMTFLSFGVLVSPRSFDDTAVEGRSNPFALALPSWVVAVEAAVFAVFAACMLASAAAAVARYRRSHGVERLQMKWLVLAGAVVAGIFALIALAGFLPSVQENATLGAVVNLALPVAVLAVPLAVGAAVLKHGLYEIDIVINKAIVYATLAVFITSVYVALVVGLGTLVGRGDEPNLVLSIAATAVVALAFQPMREKVQRFANRLVYGERATPYEVLSQFADRVGGTFEATELLPTMARTVAQGVGAVRVAVWLHTAAGWVCEATWPMGTDGPGDPLQAVPEVPAGRVTEVRHAGELLGALAVTKAVSEPLTPAEDRLVDDVAAQAGLVLRNVRLIEELRSSRERLVTTQDHERRRLERNLHDGAQQSLVSVALMLSTARAQLGADAARTGPALDQAADQLRLAIEELRELARGIHPAILTERGLDAAIASLAERSPVPVVVENQVGERLPANVEAALYYAVAEALTNVAKYAHATQATVGVGRVGQALVLEVTDDGIGGADADRGSGLHGLADRMAVVDGTIGVDSPPGRGTRLTITVPVRVAAPEAVAP